MKNEALNLKTEKPCPGCGDPAPSKAWQKDGYRYESVTCIKCGQEWGRIVDRGGIWHVLWSIGPDGQRIWPKKQPSEVKQSCERKETR